MVRTALLALNTSENRNAELIYVRVCVCVSSLQTEDQALQRALEMSLADSRPVQPAPR